MKYEEILVIYDIKDNRDRNKLHEELKDCGLNAVQKSVFWGYVLISEKKHIKEIFSKYCDIETDKMIMVNVRLSDYINDCFGYEKDDFKEPKKYYVL